jgi:hypothetical protein
VAATPTARGDWARSCEALSERYESSATTLADGDPHVPKTLSEFSAGGFDVKAYVDAFFAANPPDHAGHTAARLGECHAAAQDLIKDVVVGQHPSFIKAGGVARGAQEELARVRREAERLGGLLERMRGVEFDADAYDFGSGSEGGSGGESEEEESGGEGGGEEEDGGLLEEIEGHVARFEMGEAVEKLSRAGGGAGARKLREAVGGWLERGLRKKLRSAGPSPAALGDDHAAVSLLLKLGARGEAAALYCARRSLALGEVRGAPLTVPRGGVAAAAARSYGFFAALAEYVVEFRALCAGGRTPAGLLLWVDDEVASFVVGLCADKAGLGAPMGGGGGGGGAKHRGGAQRGGQRGGGKFF